MAEPVFPFSNPPALNAPVRQANNVASSASPMVDSVGITLPGPGVYLVTLVAKMQGSLDHAGWGTWLVYYSGDRANDTVVAQLLGTVRFAAGTGFINGLTVTDPTPAGVMTATATWSTGGSRPGAFDWTMTQLATVA